MPNLTRTTPRPMPTPAAPRTKVLLVRQPVRSVRRSDEPDRLPVRLLIGVMTAAGVLFAAWLSGYLGYALGFAPLLRASELRLDAPSGLIVAAHMLISMPMHVLQAGLADPTALMVAFLLIAIPAASLGAIKPAAPGGPRPARAIVIVSHAGAAMGIANALTLLWWSVSPMRLGLVSPLPFDPREAQTWFDNLRVAGGLDVLASIAAALWVVVIMRLAIPRWLRGLAGGFCFSGLALIFVAASMTNGAASQVAFPRSVVVLNEGLQRRHLLIGHTPRSIALLNARDQACFIELRDGGSPAQRGETLTIVASQSIYEFVKQAAALED